MRYVFLLLLLTACARPDPAQGVAAHRSIMAAPLSSTPGGPLLSSYRMNTSLQPGYAGMVYRPRTVAGPDTLTLPTNPSRASYGLTNWLTLTLNRAARITVTPDSARPDWTADWTQDGGSYWKEFGAGTVNLGAPANLKAPYDVSLLEVGGTPSLPPTTPPTAAGPRPLPVQNQPCPAWVHAQYTATGPDGISYPTWHPQIDPVYWCSFGHEHGSKPADGVSPLYGYTAGRHGMAEPHNGFKTYTIANGSARWTLTQHFGTGGLGRACTRFHTLDVAYSVSGILKADLHFMGDFGNGTTSYGNTTTNIGCPDGQDKLRAQSITTGTRVLLRADNRGYEPWRVDLRRLVLGFNNPGLTFDTGDAQTACADVSCSSLVRRAGQWGVDHRVTVNRPLAIQASGKASGIFFTDPLGERAVSASDSSATRQYVEPGLSVTGPTSTCFTVDPWVGLLNCGGRILSPFKNLENGILNGN